MFSIMLKLSNYYIEIKEPENNIMYIYMIISDKYKCIFIRVPKTGSTSIEELWKQFDPDCILSDDDTPPYGHFKCSELKNIVGEEKWNTYFKFAFIRNPKSWFKSQYTDNMQYHHFSSPKVHILLQDNYMFCDPSDKVIKIHDSIKLYVFLREWYKGPSMSAYINLDVDFIGVLENFNEDIKYVFDKIGMKEDVTLLHSNKSSSSKYTLDEDSQRFLDIVLKDDIALYKRILDAKK